MFNILGSYPGHSNSAIFSQIYTKFITKAQYLTQKETKHISNRLPMNDWAAMILLLNTRIEIQSKIDSIFIIKPVECSVQSSKTFRFGWLHVTNQE